MSSRKDARFLTPEETKEIDPKRAEHIVVAQGTQSKRAKEPEAQAEALRGESAE